MKKNSENLNEEFEEEFILEDDSENQTSLIKKLRQKLKKTEQEKQEYLMGWQRSKADFVNTKKQNEREKEEFIKFTTQNLVSELLPTLDNLESALNIKTDEEIQMEWHKGVENTYKELEKTLFKNGLEKIEPTLYTKFDPNLHDAVSLEKTDEQEKDDKVTKVMQKGFKLNDRVIRAAKVVVGEYEKNLKK